MAFYPDDTLERIRRIQELSREGHSPREAAVMIDAEEKRGQVPDDFAVSIYKGRPEDAFDLADWILRRQSKGAKRYYVGVEYIGNDCVVYVDEHIAHEITRRYYDEIIAAYREARGGKSGGE